MKKQPRITYFVRQFHGGGAQKIMLKLANATAAAGYDVDILTLESSGLFSDVTDSRVNVINLSSGRLLTAAWAIAKYIRSVRPDVVVATEVVPNIVLVLGALLSGRRRATRVVLREALYPSIAMRDAPHLATRIGYHICRYFYPRADVVIAIANAMVPDLLAVGGLDPSKVVAININPCVDDRLLTAAASPPPHPWLEPTEGTPCVVAVGRLAPQKGFSDLIDAMHLVRQRMPARLIIVGDGPLKLALQEQISRAQLDDCISLVGNTRNPYAYMSHAAVFAMPSLYEGLGNVLIEALACGAPCVAADCLVGPSETLNYGEFGRLVPVGDKVALADAIIETITNPPDRQKLRDRGLEFTAEASLRRYLPVILGTDTSLDAARV